MGRAPVDPTLAGARSRSRWPLKSRRSRSMPRVRVYTSSVEYSEDRKYRGLDPGPPQLLDGRFAAVKCRRHIHVRATVGGMIRRHLAAVSIGIALVVLPSPAAWA